MQLTYIEELLVEDKRKTVNDEQDADNSSLLFRKNLKYCLVRTHRILLVDIFKELAKELVKSTRYVYSIKISIDLLVFRVFHRVRRFVGGDEII